MNQKASKNVASWSQFISKRPKPIRPYVCSAVNEFQEERDFLASTIFPQLNTLCSSRGTYFKAVDLRWSAPKAQNSLPASLCRQHSHLHTQRLKLCLDSVNSCSPFFICLLGQTYGDILSDCSKDTHESSSSNAKQALYVAAQNGHPWVLEHFNCSVMEFEIIQAAFLNPSQFQYFYFRTQTSLPKASGQVKVEGPSSCSLVTREEELKVGKLKASIMSKGLPIRFFTGLQELGELVLKDWALVIEKFYPATLLMENIDYKHSFERFYHEEFIEKCQETSVVFKEPNKNFEILERFALKDMELDFNNAAAGSSGDHVSRVNSFPTYKSILLLSGERGCGKSTLIANWVNYFRKKYPSMLVIPHFVGSTCESSDIMTVIYYFITELQHRNYGTRFEMDFVNEDSSALVFSLLVNMFIASISLKPCILVLDGIEQLIGIYGISGRKARDFSWLPRSLPPHCKLIMSTVSSSSSYKALCARPDVRTLELISRKEKGAELKTFRQHLLVPSSDAFQQRRPAVRNSIHNNPLKLLILASELKDCGLYRQEMQCPREYLEAASVQELWGLILKRWIEDYSWTCKEASRDGLDGWVADTLCSLCISHGGLTEDELLQILDMLGYNNQYQVTALHWAAFRNVTKQWVQEKPNGLLYFWHQSLREAVEHTLLGVISPVRESSPYSFRNPTNHKKTYFHHILVRYFQRQSCFWRVYQELPWHMKMSGCCSGLCSFLSSPGIADFMSSLQSPSFWTRLQLLHYWKNLSEAGYDASWAYLLSVTRIKANECHKAQKRYTFSALESRLSETTATDRCRLLFFIGRLLKVMGKTNEAKELFTDVEKMLMQSPPTNEMLVKVQNATGELCLEIGMTQEGCQYFQKAWSNLLCFSLSDVRDNQDLMKQKVKVLNNLAKAASEEYLKENHVLEYALEVSQLPSNNPCDQATMRYTEGVLILVAGNISLARVKIQECLNIRRSLFGEKTMQVGEIMEFLADLLVFSLNDSEKSKRKQVIEYYKHVIKIKEKADTLANSFLIRKQLYISLSDTLCKLAGQLLMCDSRHHTLTEAESYLHRSLGLRATHLGPSHSSIRGILCLLKEIQLLKGGKWWPQGRSRSSLEGPRSDSSLCKHLLKLNYCSAHSSDTVSSAMWANASKLWRAKSRDSAPAVPSDRPKWASRKGKQISRPVLCLSADEKTHRKTQSPAQTWNGPGEEASKQKEKHPSRISSLDKTNSFLAHLGPRSLSAKRERGDGQITTLFRHPLLGPPSTENSWEHRLEFISEKWLFHSPDSSASPQRCFSLRSSQTETRLLKKTSDDINRE
ncbi:putative tetratricopeptide repeat protein 41 isoform X1 [Ochotona princeps]|uniref:putative tetratricopeptide repeat protein 41 isoform X1 n=1 Tax=Ochotona princeps TaxID=9978 RepID=UPI002714B587|nr:putative tetratricopeptide repeat protein 41 isoform X1 [Ochotona princeps]XP_058529018.1 putative tetratricopeptide repeat protein 41 isoform X1 [Ochotona princeps]